MCLLLNYFYAFGTTNISRLNSHYQLLIYQLLNVSEYSLLKMFENSEFLVSYVYLTHKKTKNIAGRLTKRKYIILYLTYRENGGV